MRLFVLIQFLSLTVAQQNIVKNSSPQAFVDPNNTGVVVKSPGNRSLSRPEPALCASRPRHVQFQKNGYFFSWREKSTANQMIDWLDARNYCRKRCMDLVSMESAAENEFIKRFLREANVKYIWTSGRKCNFVGCDKEHLRPNNIHGWFWSATGVKLPPTNVENPLNDWGKAGYFGNIPQPDNRQFRPIFVKRDDEACLAVLSPTIYKEPDGDYHWHDVSCHLKKPFVCEDNEKLLGYVRATNRGIAI